VEKGIFQWSKQVSKGRDDRRKLGGGEENGDIWVVEWRVLGRIPSTKDTDTKRGSGGAAVEIRSTHTSTCSLIGGYNKHTCKSM
jgi:hypothetical protein